MELRHLKYFVVVAEELSFTKAAARLRISQPPLTAQIHTLEEELELQLFNRTKHKVELTRAGEVFLAEARLTLSQAQRTRKWACQLASGSIGEVRVGFTVSAALNPQRLLSATLRRAFLSAVFPAGLGRTRRERRSMNFERIYAKS